MSKFASLRIVIFAAVTIIPVIFLLLGGMLGGLWLVAGFTYMAILVHAMDELLPTALRLPASDQDYPGANGLCILLATSHFILLFIAVRAVSGANDLAIWERCLAFIGFGLLFGQVSNSNAHELIHRSSAGLRALGGWVFTSLLFGHHATAHPAIHHVFVASAGDPNTARPGESFYRFAPRAWGGHFTKDSYWKRGNGKPEPTIGGGTHTSNTSAARWLFWRVFG
jgi:alkane 1-monooxygenase